MIYYKDLRYNFVELFNETSGTLIRSNILKDGKETDQLAYMRSFPELLDIGIMGSCEAGRSGVCNSAGIDCYQKGAHIHKPNMRLEEYVRIIEQCSGRVFQVALGGAGDPNKHECFKKILEATRLNKIVPNYTTSGYALTEDEVSATKMYCGAVAVSYYSMLDANNHESNMSTISAINRFIEAGCITNVHYVLSKKNIKEAIRRVRSGLFPSGINAVIFLLYKPVGLASKEYVLSFQDPDYVELLRLVSTSHSNWKYGFDTCQTPALNIIGKSIARESLEFCEASRFSMYIDAQSIAYPCSFGLGKSEYCVDLKSSSLKDAWNSKQFARFREKQEHMCQGCNVHGCRSCALNLGLNLCGKL